MKNEGYFLIHLSSRLTPHASRLTPLASRLTPLASRLWPHASRLTPHASGLTPHASGLTPHASGLTPHASRLFLRHQQCINNVNPAEQAMNDGPENGFVSAPGNNNGNDGSQANTRAYIYRNHVPAITPSAVTGSQQESSR